MGLRLILWRFLFIIIKKTFLSFFTTFSPNSVIVHRNYTKIWCFSRKGSCIDLFDISFYFTHNIIQFTKFPPNYYFYLVREFSWFIVNHYFAYYFITLASSNFKLMSWKCSSQFIRFSPWFIIFQLEVTLFNLDLFIFYWGLHPAWLKIILNSVRFSKKESNETPTKRT